MLVNRENGAPSPETAKRVVAGREAQSEPLEKTVIEPMSGWVSLQLGQLWTYRELLLFLTWRDVKVRYKQTYFGVAWAVLQPLFMMTVFSVFFGRFAKLPSDGVPYPIFALCGLIPWQLFQYSMAQSSNSLVTSQQLIKKVYFPRLVIPIAAVLDGLVDLSVSSVLLITMMAFYGITPTVNVVFLPLFVLFATATALSVGVWLSALNVQYRDVRYTVPFLTQIWMFATPVAYASSIVPEKWRWLYGLNPMVGVVQGFRWALLGRGSHIESSTFVSIAVVAVVMTTGVAYFRRMEASFADVI
jgi:lipopolysaccharide transport system permease protein